MAPCASQAGPYGPKLFRAARHGARPRRNPYPECITYFVAYGYSNPEAFDSSRPLFSTTLRAAVPHGQALVPAPPRLTSIHFIQPHLTSARST